MFSFVRIRAKTQRLQPGFNNNCHHSLSLLLSWESDLNTRTKGGKEKELGIEIVAGGVLCPDYLVLMNHFALHFTQNTFLSPNPFSLVLAARPWHKNRFSC